MQDEIIIALWTKCKVTTQSDLSVHVLSGVRLFWPQTFRYRLFGIVNLMPTYFAPDISIFAFKGREKLYASCVHLKQILFCCMNFRAYMCVHVCLPPVLKSTVASQLHQLTSIQTAVSNCLLNLTYKLCLEDKRQAGLSG